MIYHNVHNTSIQLDLQPHPNLKRALLASRTASISRSTSHQKQYYTYDCKSPVSSRALAPETLQHIMLPRDREVSETSASGQLWSELKPTNLEDLSLAINDSTITPPYYLVRAPLNGFPFTTCNGSEGTQHIIHLSSIEHCMPRAYIRVCLAYRLEDPTKLPLVISNLNTFVRKTIDAKPYLAGYICPAQNQPNNIGAVEIRFSDHDFLNYPEVSTKYLSLEEMPYTYQELYEQGLPPSTIKPEVISALPEGTDDARAPAFRAQANILDGGVIVSLYLHHCISDGTGLDLLATGKVLNDDFTFNRHLNSQGLDTPSLTERLAAFANQKSYIRQKLSWSFPNQVNTRYLNVKYATAATCAKQPQNAPGRGCIFQFPKRKLHKLQEDLRSVCLDVEFAQKLSKTDCLQTLLWHSMTRARIPSLRDFHEGGTGKLLTPVDIRQKLKEKLPDAYFGAAVDFASTELPFEQLSKTDLEDMARTAASVHDAIEGVDEAYVRQAIALARSTDPGVDVRDLQATNMNRVTGADMYITSWSRLNLYDADLGLGLGQPDFVRKPWSKDPGSCIILPMDNRKDYLEVVVQMTEVDMARLLNDEAFMEFVERVID